MSIKSFVSRVLVYIHTHRHQVIKYMAVGITGFLIDFGGLVVLKQMGGLNSVTAVIISQAAAMLYVFSMNKWWSFQNKEMPHKQFVRYLMLGAANYVFGVAVMYVFAERIGFDYRVVRIATIAVATSWNFLLYKHWVYA